MSKFKIGDEVTLKDNSAWRTLFKGAGPTLPTDPVFGQVYKVEWIHDIPLLGLVGIGFKEFPKVDYDEDDFEKVVSDRVLHAKLETVAEHETI